jgi:glycosyltransferase involved in cell wall biosynthesis
MNSHFSGRLALQQRVLPNYRTPFFDMLAQASDGGMSLFAGLPRPVEGITSGELQVAKYVAAHNIHILGGPLYLCYQRGLIDWLADWNPDALIVEANPRYLATPSAVRWMHARGRKVIAWGLGAPATRPFAYINQSRWGQFVRQFDALISYSQRGAQEYAALGFPPEKIFVAPNAAASRPSSMPRKPVKISRPPSTVLFVGRLQPRKRVDSLLRACAEMPQPRPRLVIVGDGPERGSLASLARQVYPSAEFIGAKHGDELKPYFAEADLFVLPGTGGLAVQEAMANGLPVIVAKGDGTQDDLVRAGNGWQIEPENYGTLVETMRSALSDPKRLRKMGEESYRIVSEEINLEKMVEVFVKALNSLR